MEKIKLVIWDLDETFWKGTLSEEGISKVDKNIAIVKELTDRGIINSISSKNDFDQAKQKLEELGIWDYFIFPHINWQPKGQQIKDIIEKAQLRDVNVLFIDDNHMNLKEAKFYNENLNVAEPDILDKLLDIDELHGKDDKTHSRLKQYKILEVKEAEKVNYENNYEFLRDSQISISFIDDLKPHKKRIVELLNRTNQLNFTKRRIGDKDFDELNKNSLECKAIKVYDRFGDYGLVGFYAIDKEKQSLVHFVFSCRVLNLGIEQFLYNYINKPKLEIVGDVSSDLYNGIPDWIEVVGEKAKIGSHEKEPKDKLKVLLKGGCDLEQMVHYLYFHNLEIEKEFNFVTKGNISIHREHTSLLKYSNEEYRSFKDRILKLEIPFIPESAFQTKVYKQDYDVMVYSLLMDYTQNLYLFAEELIVPYGGYYNALEHFSAKNKYKFQENYTHIGQIDKDEFENNLNYILSKVEKPIIFINGAELNIPNQEKKSYERHVYLNQVLDEFINKHNNCYLLDMREIVKDKTQLIDNIRHYKRDVYETMANRLIEMIKEISNNSVELSPQQTKIKLKKFKHELIQKYAKIRERI